MAKKKKKKKKEKNRKKKKKKKKKKKHKTPPPPPPPPQCSFQNLAIFSFFFLCGLCNKTIIVFSRSRYEIDGPQKTISTSAKGSVDIGFFGFVVCQTKKSQLSLIQVNRENPDKYRHFIHTRVVRKVRGLSQ